MLPAPEMMEGPDKGVALEEDVEAPEPVEVQDKGVALEEDADLLAGVPAEVASEAEVAEMVAAGVAAEAVEVVAAVAQ